MFQFKQFIIEQDKTAFKVGTDGILLGAWAEHPNPQRILDIGTGTGLLALILAQKYPDANVDAVEIDVESARQAIENIRTSPFSTHVSVFQANVYDYANDQLAYKLIICNPPFFDKDNSSLSPIAPKQQARHTVSLSHEQLLICVAKMLGTNGRFHAILPTQQADHFTRLAKLYDLHCTKEVTVKPKPSKPPHRKLLQFERAQKPTQRSTLTIETETRHIYTEEYAQLTEPFYLNLKRKNMTP